MELPEHQALLAAASYWRSGGAPHSASRGGSGGGGSQANAPVVRSQAATRRGLAEEELPVEQLHAAAGAVVARWPTAGAASRGPGLSSDHVRKAMRGTQRLAGGFRWCIRGFGSGWITAGGAFVSPI